jgi:phosphatidylglycerophosphate synthase
MVVPVSSWWSTSHMHLRRIPNTLTWLRLSLVPVLWVCALIGEERAVGFGLAIAAVTDILDGRLARVWDVCTAFGSKLDSIADSLVSFSAIGWLLLLQPNTIRNHPFYFSAAPLVALGLLWLGWLKYRKLADFHLTSGRAAGITGYLFLIHLFIFGHSLEPLLYVLMVLSWIVAAEALMIVRTYDSVDEPVPSPLLSYVTATAGRARGRS